MSWDTRFAFVLFILAPTIIVLLVLFLTFLLGRASVSCH